MLAFMDYVQNAFYQASHWNRDNSYGSLEDTARSKYFLPPFPFRLPFFLMIYLNLFEFVYPSSIPPLPRPKKKKKKRNILN